MQNIWEGKPKKLLSPKIQFVRENIIDKLMKKEECLLMMRKVN